MNRRMHANSLAAFDDIEEERGERAEVIYRMMVAAGVPMTDRQVAHALGFTDMNAVRPRLTELRDNRWVRETGSIECPVTGRHVRLVRALTETEREALIDEQRRHWQVQHSRPADQLSLSLV